MDRRLQQLNRPMLNPPAASTSTRTPRMPSTVNVSRAVRLALSESSTTTESTVDVPPGTESTVDVPPGRWRHHRPLREVLAVGHRCVCQLLAIGTQPLGRRAALVLLR